MSNSLALDAIALTELKARLPDDVGAVAWKIAGYVLLEAVTDCERRAMRCTPLFGIQ